MILDRSAKPTLTPFHLNHGDAIRFRLSDGSDWIMELAGTSAEVMERCTLGGAAQDGNHHKGEVGSYRFSAEVRINGQGHTIVREVGTQGSFYEPWCVDGVHIWLDAVASIFTTAGGFMEEKDWRHGYICQPEARARFAIQEAARSICPEPVHLWYPNTAGRLDIRDCYNGEDCWMGPYNGGATHCGLDVNMPKGTVISTPFALDDQLLFNSVAAGYINNRWRGTRRWADGAQWQIQCHHLEGMLVPPLTPLAAGTAFATGAGTAVGKHPHSHFMWRVLDQGGQYWLDPWILFWQAFRDQRAV